MLRAGRPPSSELALDPDFPTGVGMALVGAAVLWAPGTVGRVAAAIGTDPAETALTLRTGEPRGVPAVAPIPVYACKIEDDAIWVDVDQQLNDAEIPHKPFH